MHHPELPGQIRQALAEERGAFLLGNTAPDVQVVSGQERQATHFFTLPLDPQAQPPWMRVLEEHPKLAQSDLSDPAQAAFVAGYLCHLQADWTWIKDIFIPTFGPDASWGAFRQRLYLHNVLRAYMDAQIIPDLPPETAAILQTAAPEGWLPFLEDRHLVVWQDYLARQLEPGAAIDTVEVFAARQGIPPAKYHRLLESETRMDAEIFSRLPRGSLIEYRMQLIEMNVHLLVEYLRSWVQDAPVVSLRQVSGQALRRAQDKPFGQIRIDSVRATSSDNAAE